MLHRILLLLGTVILAGSLGTGCIGQFAVTEDIREWNTEVAVGPWGREAVFFSMYIIPVYPFAFFGDILFINSIEFWTGTNPISGEPSVAGAPPVEQP